MLGIVSGAFGAFRRDVLVRLAGWDVGPGEDGDLALRIRKAGFRVAFAPYAQCLTNVPSSVVALMKQRRRWEWAIVTLECRKHIDLVNFRSPNFRFGNLLLLVDRWIFGIFVHIAFVVYLIWLLANPPSEFGYVLFLQYMCFVCLELLQVCLIFYYSMDRRRDNYLMGQRFLGIAAVTQGSI